MKKRAFYGVGAVLAATLLTSGSVFAAEGLDYAMSLGQVDMGDTVNYVVEATSDGGYVAGGQTIQCFKVSMGGYRLGDLKAKAGSWVLEEGEVAPMEECIQYMNEERVEKSYGDESLGTKNADDGSFVLDFYDYCDYPGNSGKLVDQFNVNGDSSLSGKSSDAPAMRLADYDEDAYYEFSCVDYIAKFKQNGTKEWLTTIKDSDMPVAVGETTNDYRLLTEYGTLYTFAKASGDEGLSTAIDVPVINDAIINNNGTTTIVSGNEIALVKADGSLGKTLPSTISDGNVDVYGFGPSEFEYSKPLVRSANGFVTSHIVQKKTGEDPETGEPIVEASYSLVEVSTDLNTITPILTLTPEDTTDEEGLAMPVPISADKDGNVAALMYEADNEPYVATINKNGEVTATATLEEVFGNLDEYDGEDMPMVLDNYMVVDPINSRLVHFSPELKVSDTYNLGEGEMIYDAVSLTDGSMAAVGRSTASTANYTVDGGMNGTYLRIITTKASTNGTTNPNTDDGILTVAAGGSVVVVVAAGLALFFGKRR